MHRKGKAPASSLAPADVNPSTQSDTFVNEEAQKQYKNLEKKAFHYERELDVLVRYADSIHDRLNYYQWKFIELDPLEINEHMVKKFYGNLLKVDAKIVFLRGVQLDTSTHAFEALLQLSHIPPNRNAYIKIVADLIQGKISLDAVLKKIDRPDAYWENSKGENAVPIIIACSHLHPKARI
ncbi:uncharacterized protein LOC130944545 [Arachis stenosperma]|uniref:uncharacterized protein LOC130944545 n=1 Tax=Arachis stenosperma TaxID=217475 RepID=UPI0025ABE422|nr:uncharacterized protein LOC130944545 [Arachis stenosperma]